MIKRIDKRAKERGYLIYQSNELYVKQLSKRVYVFVQRNEKSFMVYRMTFEEGNPKPMSEKTIVNSTDILNAFSRAEAYVKRYMDYIKKLKE